MVGYKVFANATCFKYFAAVSPLYVSPLYAVVSPLYVASSVLHFTLSHLGEAEFGYMQR